MARTRGLAACPWGDACACPLVCTGSELRSELRARTFPLIGQCSRYTRASRSTSGVLGVTTEGTVELPRGRARGPLALPSSQVGGWGGGGQSNKGDRTPDCRVGHCLREA